MILSIQAITDGVQKTADKLDVCGKEISTLADISKSLVAAKQMCDVIIRDSGTHHKVCINSC